jgi:hypothetical protein
MDAAAGLPIINQTFSDDGTKYYYLCYGRL